MILPPLIPGGRLYGRIGGISLTWNSALLPIRIDPGLRGLPVSHEAPSVILWPLYRRDVWTIHTSWSGKGLVGRWTDSPPFPSSGSSPSGPPSSRGNRPAASGDYAWYEKLFPRLIVLLGDLGTQDKENAHHKGKNKTASQPG